MRGATRYKRPEHLGQRHNQRPGGTRLYAVFNWAAVERADATGPDVALCWADGPAEAVRRAWTMRPPGAISSHQLAAEERPGGEAEACAEMLARPGWAPYGLWLGLRDQATQTAKNAAARKRAAARRAEQARAQEREELAG